MMRTIEGRPQNVYKIVFNRQPAFAAVGTFLALTGMYVAGNCLANPFVSPVLVHSEEFL
jgi:hypothetical protein